MTEAEKKAKELVERFFNRHAYMTWDMAIQCALICVDEIVKSQYLNRKTTNKFWEEVKQAIEKQ